MKDRPNDDDHIYSLIPHPRYSPHNDTALLHIFAELLQKICANALLLRTRAHSHLRGLQYDEVVHAIVAGTQSSAKPCFSQKTSKDTRRSERQPMQDRLLQFIPLLLLQQFGNRFSCRGNGIPSDILLRFLFYQRN